MDRLRGDGSLSLRAARWGGDTEFLLRGSLEVPENRRTHAGRRITLQVTILPCTGKQPAAAPLCILAGGPGQAASAMAGMWRRHPVRTTHDILLVDQRGTGGSNPLRVELGDVTDFSRPLMDPAAFRRALPELRRRADLRCYTSEDAAHDLDAVRAALGAEQLSLWGGSYGTRMALVYMRRFPRRIRCAVLDGVAPIAFRNPLYHARSAQRALDLAFAEVRKHPTARTAFPDLERRFGELLERLERAPVTVEITTQGRRTVTVTLDRDVFASGLRVLLYYTGTARRVPLMLHRAMEGDFKPFALAALRSNLALRRSLCFGMLLCVTASEDLPRIDPDEIETLTAGTFLGDVRVRQQLALAKFWPRGPVPADYGEPVSVPVPTLLCSGTHDAVTPPEWGERATSHLPNSRHLVVPGAHGVTAIPQVRDVMLAFLRSADVDSLDLRPLNTIKLPALALPPTEAEFDGPRWR